MGLDSNFKAYLRSTHAKSVLNDAPQEPPGAMIVDVMCILHQWSGQSDKADDLFSYVWRTITFGAHPDCVVVACFDHLAEMPRTKEPEFEKRHVAKAEMGRDFIQKSLAEGVVPSPWRDVLASRDGRTEVLAAMCRSMHSRYANEGRTFARLVTHGAGRRGAVESDRDGRSESEVEWASVPMLGEGDVALAFWAIRLRNSLGDKHIYIRTVDTDLVGIAMLHKLEHTFVVLNAWNRTERRMDFTFVDVTALKASVKKELGMRPIEFVVCAIMRGCDFVERCVRGMPEWGPYMIACSTHLKTSTLDGKRSSTLFTRTGDQFVLEAGTAIRMLHSVTCKGGKRERSKVTATQDTLRRVFWSVSYWTLAPEGRAHLVDPLSGKFGWELNNEGKVVISASKTVVGGKMSLNLV